MSFDGRALFNALDARRVERDLGWTAAPPRDVGCSPNRLTAMRKARFAVTMSVAMSVTKWLGRPAADFVVAAQR